MGGGGGGAGELGEKGGTLASTGGAGGDGICKVVDGEVTYNFAELFGTDYGEVSGSDVYFGFFDYRRVFGY